MLTQYKFIDYGRKTSVFFLLACSFCYQDSSWRRKWLQSLSFSSAPCEKELNTDVGWLLSLSHKYAIWAFLSFRFLSLWFIVVPRCHCWHWLACGYTFLIPMVWHTNYCLSQASSSLTLTTVCSVGKVKWMYLQLPFTFPCSLQQLFCIFFCLVRIKFTKKSKHL